MKKQMISIAFCLVLANTALSQQDYIESLKREMYLSTNDTLQFLYAGKNC